MTAPASPSLNNSRRTELLPMAVLDLAAWLFVHLPPSWGRGSLTAVELHGDYPLHSLLFNTHHCLLHSGNERLLHADDADWAILFPHDCPGTVAGGERFIASYPCWPDRDDA